MKIAHYLQPVILVISSVVFTVIKIECLAPYSSFRSQGRDKTRQLIGSVDRIHLAGQQDWWGTGSIFLGYTKTFHGDRLAESIFGTDITHDCCTNQPTILIQGSQLANRDPRAWLADYFYLPPDFSSSFVVSPSIKNLIIDFNLYFGLDCWWPGLYAWAYGPICNTKWNLGFKETMISTGTQGYPAGYFSETPIARTNLLQAFNDYAQGSTITSVDSIIFNPLQVAKLTTDSREKTGFADLRAEFGWNWYLTDCGHIGINIQTAAPTGNKPDPEFIFSPVIGNGNHWELGGGVSAHYIFYYNELCQRQIGIYIDANITHLFGIRQKRTFDLCGKPNSRYMLLELLDRPVENNLSASTTSNMINMDDPIINPTAQFMREFNPVANLTTDFVKVSAGVQADIVAMLNFSFDSVSIDLGYNFWALSCERIECPESGNSSCTQPSPCNLGPSLCTSAQENKWALKGDSRVFGFMIANGINLMQGAPVALSATENNATIHQGTNALITNPAALSDPEFKKNYGVDTARFAYGDASNTALTFSPTTILLTDQIKTSLLPQFVSCTNINFQRTRGLSHKIFAHINYTYDCYLSPYLGVGSSAEFGSNKTGTHCTENQQTAPSSFSTKCSNCLTVSLSQWSIWVKGGLSF